MKRLAWIGFVTLSMPACVAFNDVCTSDSTPVIGRTERSLEVQADRIRLAESSLGNLMADAMRAAATEADAALFPAGYISEQTACGPREFLVRGDVRQNDVDDLLPDDDSIAVVSLTSEDLYSVLEHSVAALADRGSAAASPAFMQVSNLFFSVDCTGIAQRLSTDGQTVALEGTRIVPNSLVLDSAALAPGASVRLAVPLKLLSGKLGFVALTQPGRLLLDTKVSLRSALSRYISANSPVDPVTQGRITLRDSCF